jgi:hypothetical protein
MALRFWKCGAVDCDRDPNFKDAECRDCQAAEFRIDNGPWQNTPAFHESMKNMEEMFDRLDVLAKKHGIELKPAEPVKWLGGTVCNFCKQPITGLLYDTKTVYNCWATMCDVCHATFGTSGLGTGIGQVYEQQPDDTFVKVGG